jgi:hypothetical protein
LTTPETNGIRRSLDWGRGNKQVLSAVDEERRAFQMLRLPRTMSVDPRQLDHRRQMRVRLGVPARGIPALYRAVARSRSAVGGLQAGPRLVTCGLDDPYVGMEHP